MSLLRSASFLVVILAAVCGGRAAAENAVVDPSTLELGLTSYRVTISDGTNTVDRTLPPALSEMLSYAFSQSFAYASGVAVAGRDLVVGTLSLRWYPRGDARILSEREGPLEVSRASTVKPFVSTRVEYGRVRSSYVFDPQEALELVATFQGLGIGAGARLDLTDHFGVGAEVALSQWSDTPESSLTINSTTYSARVEGHMNF
jgi:hypothetical protein